MKFSRVLLGVAVAVIVLGALGYWLGLGRNESAENFGEAATHPQTSHSSKQAPTNFAGALRGSSTSLPPSASDSSLISGGVKATVTQNTTVLTQTSTGKASSGNANAVNLTLDEMKAALLSQKRDLSDPRQREELVRQLKAVEDTEIRSAHARARQMGIRIHGLNFTLVGFDGDVPRYMGPGNVNAAISTGTHQVRAVAPFNVNGRVEDGPVGMGWHTSCEPPDRITHQNHGARWDNHFDRPCLACGRHAHRTGGESVSSWDGPGDESGCLFSDERPL